MKPAMSDLEIVARVLDLIAASPEYVAGHASRRETMATQRALQAELGPLLPRLHLLLITHLDRCIGPSICRRGRGYPRRRANPVDLFLSCTDSCAACRHAALHALRLLNQAITTGPCQIEFMGEQEYAARLREATEREADDNRRSAQASARMREWSSLMIRKLKQAESRPAHRMNGSVARQGSSASLGDPDSAGFVQQPSDATAYLPAHTIIENHPTVAKSHKVLTALLGKHPEIRRWKPSKQRLLVHAGDWQAYIDLQSRRTRDEAGFLNDPAEVAQRAAAVRQAKSKRRHRPGK